MKLMQCIKKHYYDGDIYTVCPYCTGAAGNRSILESAENLELKKDVINSIGDYLESHTEKLGENNLESHTERLEGNYSEMYTEKLEENYSEMYTEILEEKNSECRRTELLK